MVSITVITAVAPNEVHLLARAWESVRSQDTDDWRWVIAEDGPTHGAAPMADLDARITVINSAHGGGPAQARNLAATEVETPWMRNLDADDVLADAAVLRRTIETITAEPEVTYLLGPVTDILPDGTPKTFPVPVPVGVIEPGTLHAYWAARGCVHALHPTALTIETETFFRHGGYPGLRSSEDTAMLMRMSNTEVGYRTDFTLTHYIKRAESITASGWHHDPTDRGRRLRFAALCAEAQTLPERETRRGGVDRPRVVAL